MDYMYMLSLAVRGWSLLGTMLFVWVHDQGTTLKTRDYIIFGPLIFAASLVNNSNFKNKTISESVLRVISALVLGMSSSALLMYK